jgi:hypothetical protein
LWINEATPERALRFGYVRSGAEIRPEFGGFTAPQVTKGIRRAQSIV